MKWKKLEETKISKTNICLLSNMTATHISFRMWDGNNLFLINSTFQFPRQTNVKYAAVTVSVS